MNCKFEDFENHFFANLYPVLKTQLDQSFNDSMSKNEIISDINANILGTSISLLSEYHNWLINNYDISPK